MNKKVKLATEPFTAHLNGYKQISNLQLHGGDPYIAGKRSLSRELLRRPSSLCLIQNYFPSMVILPPDCLSGMHPQFLAQRELLTLYFFICQRLSVPQALPR